MFYLSLLWAINKVSFRPDAEITPSIQATKYRYEYINTFHMYADLKKAFCG